MSTTPQTTEELKTAALAAEKAPPAAPPASIAPAAPVVENKDFGKVTRHPDGKLEIEYVTGEVFKGTPEEVLAAVSKSNVETKKHLKEVKAAAVPAPPVSPAAPTEDEQVAAAVLEYMAKGLGKDPATFKQDIEKLERHIELQEYQTSAQQFLAKHPEFPNDQASADKLTDTLKELGLPMSARNLEVAHAYAVSQNAYQVLTPQQINAIRAQQYGAVPGAAPPIPPPNPPTGGARTEVSSTDPYQMPMEELKKLAIEQSRRGQ